MPQYATVSDYYEFIGKVQPDPLGDADSLALNALLRRASNDIKGALRLVRMTLDADGVPTKTSAFEARRDATSATVAAWIGPDGEIADADPTGASAGWDSISLIGVSFSRAQRATGSGQASSSSQITLAPEAAKILQAEFGSFSAVNHPGV